MSSKTRDLLAVMVGLGAGLIFSVHPFSWTVGMLSVFAFFFLGLGVFIGWKFGPPVWLKNTIPGLADPVITVDARLLDPEEIRSLLRTGEFRHEEELPQAQIPAP